MSEASDTIEKPSGSPGEGFVSMWEPGDRSFQPLVLSLIERKGANTSEYYVYSDEENFKTVEAETAIKALETSDISEPLKIFHAHCRKPTIIESTALEYSKEVMVALDEETESQEDIEARKEKAKAELAKALQNGVIESSEATAKTEETTTAAQPEEKPTAAESAPEEAPAEEPKAEE